ncbi:monomeric glyoxalase I [Piedraia hortae CBS 480.64]|uniref:lactoylglutathione lyase n=1 Tax=Piedraia hortae CBS 480.64 TaxID=1314780 RepID=A0A6A7BPB6_9PEZI|nr:monomeric glyoxalase I [Piedraia hortae CBS 480.64]
MTDPNTYKLNHTMVRITNPEASLKFYKFLGMSLIEKKTFPDHKFDLYFLAYDSDKSTSKGKHWTDREGILELTHNYDAEKPSNGNDDPLGYGHIGLYVDNLQAACKRLADAGYKFQKYWSDGSINVIAFVVDPDGYWVELVATKPIEETASITTTDPEEYKLYHSMIRVKDPKISLKFYEDVMGMKLVTTMELPDSGSTIYFVGYGDDGEGLVELTWVHGSEKKEGQVYHNGNTEPKGFGHLCISVDHLQKACDRFDEKKVKWQKRLTDGRMKNVAFLLDPDEYWIEVIQNERFRQPPGEY